MLVVVFKKNEPVGVAEVEDWNPHYAMYHKKFSFDPVLPTIEECTKAMPLPFVRYTSGFCYTDIPDQLRGELVGKSMWHEAIHADDQELFGFVPLEEHKIQQFICANGWTTR